MSTDEYTPTTEVVRTNYARRGRFGEVHPEWLAAFDRWLAQHDREVAEKALRDAADEDFNQEPLYHGPHPFDVLNRRADALTVADAPAAEPVPRVCPGAFITVEEVIPAAPERCTYPGALVIPPAADDEGGQA